MADFEDQVTGTKSGPGNANFSKFFEKNLEFKNAQSKQHSRQRPVIRISSRGASNNRIGKEKQVKRVGEIKDNHLYDLSRKIQNCRLQPDGTIIETNLSLKEQLTKNQRELKEKLMKDMVDDSIANAMEQIKMRKQCQVNHMQMIRPTQIVQQ